jgi:nucleotide-binding universal stress UspA family protein
MFDNILLTVDGSAQAEQAIPYAVELARCHNGKLRVLRVANIVAPLDFDVGSSLFEQLVRGEQSAADDYVQKTVESIQATGIQVDGEVVSGDPATVILEAAAKNDCDVIVMATHGRSGLSRLVFGSVADQVLRGSPAPVLLVRVAETKTEPIEPAAT